VDAVELGAITERSVRVWVRAPDQSSVTASLHVDGRAPVEASVALSEATDWTGAITLTLATPAPETPFTCRVGPVTRSGVLAPAPGTPAALTFGFGSCHMPYGWPDGAIVVRDDAQIYPAITADLQRAQARLLVLLGDQIYADMLPGIGIDDAVPGGPDVAPPLDTVLRAYRQNYRGFFNEPGFRDLRQAFPTICMWDDHDILNDWGSRLSDTPRDRAVFAAASRAFCEYQHQRNPGGGIGTPPYMFTYTYGDIGFLALDLRGERDAATRTMLGEEQWERLHTYLTGEEAAQIQTLVVVSSVPLAHASRWFTLLMERLPGETPSSVRGRWSASRFIAERDRLLDHLFAWQAGAPQRQVVVLSGDVHCASAFTIRQRSGPGVITQITSSAMTTPLVLKQMVANRVVVRAANLFEPRYRFERQFLSITHNLGIARLIPLWTGGHRITLTIRSWNPHSQSLTTTGRLSCTCDRVDKG
jgi:phosphodiesterase/alkaline phosphatase D-like protein